MKRPRIIGLCGYARVGKDSAGQTITEAFDYRRVACADPLKDLAYASNELVRVAVDAYDWEGAKDKVAGVRPALVSLGSAGRMVFAEGEDFWIRQALAGAGEDNVVVTDVRFPNEARVIREHDPDALIIRINRPGFGASSDFEKPVDEVPYTFAIYNNGTDMASFQQAVRLHVGEYLKSCEEPEPFLFDADVYVARHSKFFNELAYPSDA